jgi:hypothetical protein
VYGSELICRRLEPTGFPGVVGGDEEDEEEVPEHPANASIHQASKKETAVFLQETSTVMPIV